MLKHTSHNHTSLGAPDTQVAADHRLTELQRLGFSPDALLALGKVAVCTSEHLSKMLGVRARMPASLHATSLLAPASIEGAACVWMHAAGVLE